MAQEFSRLCLSGTFMADTNSAETERLWSEPDDSALAAAGLTSLKKAILEMPGGGAVVSERQLLRQARFGNTGIVLAVEAVLERDKPVRLSCNMFSRDEQLLETCTALGRAIGKAPDANRKYPALDAHFIEWNVQLEAKPGLVTCERAPRSPILPYDGVALKLVLDLTQPQKRQIAINTAPNRVDR
ncbi:MAG: hypothetical protein R3D32_07645 [Nitratireductor sp.]